MLYRSNAGALVTWPEPFRDGKDLDFHSHVYSGHKVFHKFISSGTDFHHYSIMGLENVITGE